MVCRWKTPKEIYRSQAKAGTHNFVFESAIDERRRSLDLDMFIDDPQGRPSEAVHLLYAGEKVRPEFEHVLPDIQESERAAEFQVTSLDALVRMKLISYRRKDQVHLLDLIGVGLIDATWPARFPPPLGDRLQMLLDDPNG